VGWYGSGLAPTTVGTIRTRLLKVMVSVRRVWARLSSAFVPIPGYHQYLRPKVRGCSRQLLPFLTICLARATKGEEGLVSRLRAAWEKLNPALPPAAITAVVADLTTTIRR